jgi:hypothetical protein
MRDPLTELIEELEYERVLCLRTNRKNLEPGLARALEIVEELRNQEDE